MKRSEMQTKIADFVRNNKVNFEGVVLCEAVIQSFSDEIIDLVEHNGMLPPQNEFSLCYDCGNQAVEYCKWDEDVKNDKVEEGNRW